MDRPSEAAPEGFMHGWYSAKHDDRAGTATYVRENGERVVITEVSEPPVPASKWDDIVYKGLVLHHNNGGCVGRTADARRWR